MDEAFKIIRYTLAALMASGSLIINANAADMNHIETTANAGVSVSITAQPPAADS